MKTAYLTRLDDEMLVAREYLNKTIEEYLPQGVVEHEGIVVFLLSRRRLVFGRIFHRVDVSQTHSCG